NASACLLFLFSRLFSSARFCPGSSSALARRLDPLLQLPASCRGRGDSHCSRRVCLEAPILGREWSGRLGSQSPGWATARAGGGSPGPSRSLPPRAPPAPPRAAAVSQAAARGHPGGSLPLPAPGSANPVPAGFPCRSPFAPPRPRRTRSPDLALRLVKASDARIVHLWKPRPKMAFWYCHYQILGSKGTWQFTKPKMEGKLEDGI
uniref:Uncharacterized protein n=1 Tax=Mustela putorius furo TaxID=9669 RepID=M3XMN0_MUSPF